MSNEFAHEEHEVEVKVTYPNSMSSTSFRFPWSGTLQELWDEAYAKLEEGKKPEDELLNKEGASLGQYLGLSLREAHDRHLCPGFTFIIKSETGGAHPDYGVPVLNTPSKATAAFEEHLRTYLEFLNVHDISDVGIRVIDPLTMIVPVNGTGNGHVDEYTLRMNFGYYPTWPPSARFVNPETLSYEKGKDTKWLPKIQGTNEIAVHPDYNGQGQLICNSMTLEFYLVNHSYTKREHLWQPGMTFQSTLTIITWALSSKFYQGRQAS